MPSRRAGLSPRNPKVGLEADPPTARRRITRRVLTAAARTLDPRPHVLLGPLPTSPEAVRRPARRQWPGRRGLRTSEWLRDEGSRSNNLVSHRTCPASSRRLFAMVAAFWSLAYRRILCGKDGTGRRRIVPRCCNHMGGRPRHRRGRVVSAYRSRPGGSSPMSGRALRIPARASPGRSPIRWPR